MENQNPAGLTQAAKPKRITRRSPNFPYIALDDAIDRIRVVAGLEHQHPTSGSVILKHLGYKETVTGTGARVIAALRQYGLLEDSGNQLRVSDFAYRLIHLLGGSTEKIEGLRQAALNPNIFRDLFNHYSGTLPSNENMSSFLIINRGFNPRSVGDFIKVFRTTVNYANLSPGNQFPSQQQPPPGGMMETLEQQQQHAPQPEASRRISEAVGKTGPDYKWTWTLSIPRNVNVEVRLSGDVKPGDFDQLKVYINSLQSAFSELPVSETAEDNST